MAARDATRKWPHSIGVRVTFVVAAVCLAIPGGNVLASSIEVTPSPQPFAVVGAATLPAVEHTPVAAAPSPEPQSGPPSFAPVEVSPTSDTTQSTVPEASDPTREPLAEGGTAEPEQLVEASDAPVVTPSPSASEEDLVVAPLPDAWSPCVALPNEPSEASLDCGRGVALRSVDQVDDVAAHLVLTISADQLIGRQVVVGWTADKVVTNEIGRVTVAAIGDLTVPIPPASNITTGHWTLAVL